MAATTASFQDAELIPLPVEDWAFVPFAVRTSFAVRWGGGFLTRHSRVLNWKFRV